MAPTDEEGDDSDESNNKENQISNSQQYRNIACKWFEERDMDEIAPLIEEFPNKKRISVYLNVSRAVRSLYGYKLWVLFLNELIIVNQVFQRIYQKNITNSFAKMIIGTKISTKKSRISSSSELHEAINFLENNTPLKGPKITDIRNKIQDSIIKKKITKDALKRITSVFHGIDKEYSQLQAIKLMLLNLNKKRRDYLDTSNSSSKISTSKIRKQVKGCNKKPGEHCIEIYENLLFKKKIKRRRIKKEIIANLSFLYGLKHQSDYDLSQEFLRISKQTYSSLGNSKKAAECEFNSLRIFYLKETKLDRNYIALRTLETIKKQFTLNHKSHLFRISTEFLVRSYFDIYFRFKKKCIFGIAEDSLDNMQLHLDNIEEREKTFYNEYCSNLRETRINLKETTPEIIFVFDTSFFCCMFELFSNEKGKYLKDSFKMISDFFQHYSELDYVAPTEIINEIPRRYRDHIRMIDDTINFQRYKIDYQQIEDLKIMNAMYTKRSFDTDEMADYIIIQNAVNHKSSENTLIIVSNDEGIHKYCEKNLPGKKISVIWCHSLIEFIAKNEKLEWKSRKLHDISSKMKKKLEKYRKENKRRKIEKYSIEQLLLSLDLEKRN